MCPFFTPVGALCILAEIFGNKKRKRGKKKKERKKGREKRKKEREKEFS